MTGWTSQEALRVWHTAIVNGVKRKMPDLTNRQMAVLLTIYMASPPHTVRGMAAHLKVSKPVITRALDTLCRLELVRRRRDDKDRRNIFVERTVKGAVWLTDYSELVTQASNGGGLDADG